MQQRKDMKIRKKNQRIGLNLCLTKIRRQERHKANYKKSRVSNYRRRQKRKKRKRCQNIKKINYKNFKKLLN